MYAVVFHNILFLYFNGWSFCFILLVKVKICLYCFSIHEVGYYDTRNSIDYILNVTNQNDVIYIGYSQGTTDFLIMASEFPEYNDKIRLAVLLGPIAFLSHMIAPGYRLLALFTDELLVNKCQQMNAVLK